MTPFTTLCGLVAPMDRSDVDTDAIIPKQYLKSLKRTGFGPALFDQWRYLTPGESGMDHSTRPLNPEFVLNEARYAGAQILLARSNFGCGSSREHAAWALLEYGFRCIIAPSFADIFYNNCFKNGILPVVVAAAAADRLFDEVAATPGYMLDVDLPAQRITGADGDTIPFEVEASRKHALVGGLDDISLTLDRRAAIREYERRRRVEAPWLFEE